jgi:hypothetical protein
MTNITYVSFLLSCPDDRVSIEQRVEWFLPLFNCKLPLILFVDETYARYLQGRVNGIILITIRMEDLETVREIRAKPLHLPPQRSKEKDTLNFMTLMNCKPELLVRALPFVRTPYVAYIDAGISKVMKDPSTLSKLSSLKLKDIPLILMPGCHPISKVENFPLLWNGIHWMLSGGFFVVPIEFAETWYDLHRAALKKFLDMGTITWEVNVWASFLHRFTDHVVWYKGMHTDDMILKIPEAVLDCS